MILLDATTLAAYLAESTAALKAQAVVNALANPVDVKVYDGSGNLKGSGVMATPWAAQAAGVITVAELTSFGVSVSGTPDANWYLRFESGSRWVRGSFGLAGSARDFTWSLASWTAGQGGQLGTVTLGVPSNAAPSLVGAPSTLSFNVGIGGTYDFSVHKTDPDSDTPLVCELVGTAYTGVSMSSSGLLTVTAAASAAVRNLTIRITDPGGLSSDFACAVTIASTRILYYEDDFSSGRIFTASESTSLMPRRGGTLYCKFQPEGGVNTHYLNTDSATWLSGMNGQSTDSRLDARVLALETWNGEAITPRSGQYFMRQALYYDKQYESINGATDQNYDLDKPRVRYEQSGGIYQFEWDQELWCGFSVRLPSTYQDDVATKNHQGGTALWILNAGPDNTQLSLHRYAIAGQTVEHWWVMHQDNDTAVVDMNQTQNASGTVFYDLGAITADKGKWTDFVFRVRINPFTVATNASSVGGKNQVYQGNKGILQLWKGTGAVNLNGNRTMSRLINKVNQPIGGVPHATLKLRLSHRMYKYGWKKNPTNVTTPIYQAFDAIRWGFADAGVASGYGQSGPTTAADVSPSGEALS